MSIEVVVEVPYHSNVKYEFNEKGQLYVDRVISTSMMYPGNYGFIPNTLAGDGDPVDVLILGQTAFYPGSRVRCVVLGLLETKDEKGSDEKIIAVPEFHRPSLHDLNDVAPHLLHQIRHFFQNYKNLARGKTVVEVGAFRDRAAALKFIAQSPSSE